MADPGGIVVSVNGESLHLPTGATLAELVRRLSLEGRPIAVEHNRRVVPKAEHEAVHLNHGDAVEIVTFVGGGSVLPSEHG
jgi:thiamine biosynthesis protein ThiS